MEQIHELRQLSACSAVAVPARDHQSLVDGAHITLRMRYSVPLGEPAGMHGFWNITWFVTRDIYREIAGG